MSISVRVLGEGGAGLGKGWAEGSLSAYLGEALLAVVLEVLGVDVDVVLVHAVGLRELGGVLDKLLHLHRGWVSLQVLKGLHRHVGGGDAVWAEVEEETGDVVVLGTVRARRGEVERGGEVEKDGDAV